jgi:hypothetical protein
MTSKLGLQNLTPEDESMMQEVGITSKAQFDKLGAHKAFALIKSTYPDADQNLLYRLRGAEKDLDWQIIAQRERKRAKSRFADVDEP